MLLWVQARYSSTRARCFTSTGYHGAPMFSLSARYRKMATLSASTNPSSSWRTGSRWCRATPFLNCSVKCSSAREIRELTIVFDWEWVDWTYSSVGRQSLLEWVSWLVCRRSGPLSREDKSGRRRTSWFYPILSEKKLWTCIFVSVYW